MDRPARLRRHRALLALLCPLAGCATDYSGLRLEQRPDENAVRIANVGTRPLTLHYNFEDSFGDYQMLRVRFRDGEGRIIPLGPDGWWSPLALSSSLTVLGDHVPRRTLHIAAGGRVDLARDFGALLWGANVPDPISGPCTAQLMLVGYRGARAGQRQIQVPSDWQLAECPRPPRLNAG